MNRFLLIKSRAKNQKERELSKVVEELITQKVKTIKEKFFLDYYGDPVGPLRVWNKTVDLPGLAMTRCFGDKAGIPAGIICEPEIKKYSLSPEEEAVIIIGSDGIFEFISNIEVF